jgi:hypothetical protein
MWHRYATERGKVSTSAHLWGTGMSFRFKWRKNWGRRKSTVIKQCWSQVVWLLIMSELVRRAPSVTKKKVIIV